MEVLHDSDDRAFNPEIEPFPHGRGGVKPHELRNFLVDQKGPSLVRGKLPGERSSGGHFDFHGFRIIEIDGPVADQNLLGRVLAVPIGTPGIAAEGRRRLIGRRDAQDPGIPEKLFFESGVRRVRLPTHRQVDELLLVVAELLPSHVIDLTRDNPHSDEKENGQAELENDQGFPERGALNASSHPAAHDPDGLKRGEEKGRVASGHDPGEENNRQNPEQEFRTEEDAQGHRLSGKGVERRKKQTHQDDRDGPGQEGHEDGFAVELADDAFPLSADDFPQTDLAGPVGRACRSQVHEVDAGDQEDEQGDGNERIDILDRHVVPAEAEISEQPDVDEGPECKGWAPVAFKPAAGLGIALNLLHLLGIGPYRGDVSVPDELGNLLSRRSDVASGMKLNEGQDAIGSHRIDILAQSLDEIEWDEHIEG